MTACNIVSPIIRVVEYAAAKDTNIAQRCSLEFCPFLRSHLRSVYQASKKLHSHVIPNFARDLVARFPSQKVTIGTRFDIV